MMDGRTVGKIINGHSADDADRSSAHGNAFDLRMSPLWMGH
jgi:hypothetical protein